MAQEGCLYLAGALHRRGQGSELTKGEQVRGRYPVYAIPVPHVQRHDKGKCFVPLRTAKLADFRAVSEKLRAALVDMKKTAGGDSEKTKVAWATMLKYIGNVAKVCSAPQDICSTAAVAKACTGTAIRSGDLHFICSLRRDTHVLNQYGTVDMWAIC